MMTSYIDLESDTGVTCYGYEENNNVQQMYFGRDSRSPAIRETFRVAYFYVCDWLSGLGKTTATRATLNAEINLAA